jgi:hypothetical protein
MTDLSTGEFVLWYVGALAAVFAAVAVGELLRRWRDRR